MASLLAKDGYKITLIEKNSELGGRMRAIEEKGFMFDIGPSWYWMPEVFENFYSKFGYKTSDFYNLVDLNPQYKFFFDGNNTVEISKNIEENIWNILFISS